MATVKSVLTPGSWTNLGATPLYLQNTSSNSVFFVIDTASPVNADPNAVDAHVLDADTPDRQSDVNVTLTGNVYARGNGPVVVSR